MPGLKETFQAQPRPGGRPEGCVFEGEAIAIVVPGELG